MPQDWLHLPFCPDCHFACLLSRLPQSMDNLHVDMYTWLGHGSQVWATIKQMCRYAIQHGCRWGCLTTGKELLCCSFHTVEPLQVSLLSVSGKNVHVQMWKYPSMHHTTCIPSHLGLQLDLMACGRVKMWSAFAVSLQGRPSELVMSLADVVSYSSTDPTMAQDLVYMSTVQSHSGAFCGVCHCW